MSAVIVLGAQWGDEGKGKIVDVLCEGIQLCCRAQGGVRYTLPITTTTPANCSLAQCWTYARSFWLYMYQESC
jgi:hypothetical protein